MTLESTIRKMNIKEIDLDDLIESLDEKPRQIKDPKKEMMISYKGSVMVINKKDWPKYEKKGAVQAEENELDEGGMKDKLLKTADLLQKLIKPGDPDRHDFAAVRDHIESNNMKTVKQILSKMDTEPRERVVDALAKGLGKAEAEKILGVKLNMSEEVKEEMTEAQKAKREEIVKELKKKTEDFKKKYGDRWEDVMYATATKMAMKAA